MMLQGADLRVWQHRRGSSDRLWPPKEEREGSPDAAPPPYSTLARQPGPDAARRVGGGVFAAVSMEDAVAHVWAVEDVDAMVGTGAALPLPTLLCRRIDEALLESRREQAHLQQCQSSSSDARPGLEAVLRSPTNMTGAGIGLGDGLQDRRFSAARPLDYYPAHQQQLQNGCGYMVPSYTVLEDKRRHARPMGIDGRSYGDGRIGEMAAGNPVAKTAAGNYCNDGLIGYGGEEWCRMLPAGGRTVAGSPKSSISSDGSGGDIVGESPAAVWEMDVRRGATRRGGGDAGSCDRTKKRPFDAVADDDGPAAGHWRAPGSAARSRNGSSQSDDAALEQLLLLAGEGEQIEIKREREQQLLQHLKIISLERDEARNQLQTLLTKLAQPSPPEPPSAAHLHPDPLLAGGTEINFDSSSMKSLLDPAPTAHPIALNIMADTCTTRSTFPASSFSTAPAAASQADGASALIDRLVAKRALPEKGKLLQAVMEAGPLLQTLLVAGPLPRWRNPPPLQPCQIPPVSVLRPRRGGVPRNPTSFPVHGSSKALPRQNPPEASTQIPAAASSSTGSAPFSPPTGPPPPTCASSYRDPAGKRKMF